MMVKKKNPVMGLRPQQRNLRLVFRFQPRIRLNNLKTSLGFPCLHHRFYLSVFDADVFQNQYFISKKCIKLRKTTILTEYIALIHSNFMDLNRNCKEHVLLFGKVNVHSINISFDMIVYTLTKIFHSDH